MVVLGWVGSVGRDEEEEEPEWVKDEIPFGRRARKNDFCFAAGKFDGTFSLSSLT